MKYIAFVAILKTQKTCCFYRIFYIYCNKINCWCASNYDKYGENASANLNETDYVDVIMVVAGTDDDDATIPITYTYMHITVYERVRVRNQTSAYIIHLNAYRIYICKVDSYVYQAIEHEDNAAIDND